MRRLSFNRSEPTKSSRNRWFADSLLEGDGFELLVPRHKSRGFPQHSGHGGGWAGLFLKTAPPDCSVLLLLRTGVERDRSRWRAGALRIFRLGGGGRKFRRDLGSGSTIAAVLVKSTAEPQRVISPGRPGALGVIASSKSLHRHRSRRHDCRQQAT